MQNKKSQTTPLFLGEKDAPIAGQSADQNSKSRLEKFKKPILFTLMGIIFLCSVYLIFRPSPDKNKLQDAGLNDQVPEASGAGLQADKQKAYEQALLEQKDQEKKDALMSLSDYWHDDSLSRGTNVRPDEQSDREEETIAKKGSGNTALRSYQNAQSTLRTFYNDGSAQSEELRKQISELKEQLKEREGSPQPFTVNDQLALMEKSYQMAARYLPDKNATNNSIPTDKNSDPGDSITSNQKLTPLEAVHKNIVSALRRETGDKEFIENINSERNLGFYTAEGVQEAEAHHNGIRAYIQETQTIVGDGVVRLRLLETVRAEDLIIPIGTIITANARFGNGRLLLNISSVQWNSNIIPINIIVYGLDGQPGLRIPFSPERNAITDIVANMGNATGSSFSMSSTAGQQVISDLSKSAIQGVSGYFAKKVRMPKVTLKAGLQVLLVAKK